ncbi:MAG: stress protein [Epulopiscium sp. Nele67-Bin001]|nr:MAG: stress protein [Epulopiscium sp. Nuni2H_MBin001]OON94771.1 MAG: stress protein [Epulopiscium sp. Nele67-Bin001]
MSVNLSKGQKVNLSKGNEGLSKIIVGLGWDEVKKKGGLFSRAPKAIDCDASAVLLSNQRLIDNKDVVYFKNLIHSSGAVAHTGDNITGAGENDDEQIRVDLTQIPSEYDSLVIFVNIYQAVERKQHFGMIDNAFIRVVDARNDKELCRYNLTDDYSDMTAVLFGELYLQDGEWQFNAMGQGTQDAHLGQVIQRYC